MSELNEIQSSAIKVEVLDCWCFALFRYHSASQATGVENLRQIWDFFTPVKFRWGRNIWVDFHELGLGTNLWYTFNGTPHGRLGD